MIGNVFRYKRIALRNPNYMARRSIKTIKLPSHTHSDEGPQL